MSRNSSSCWKNPDGAPAQVPASPNPEMVANWKNFLAQLPGKRRRLTARDLPANSVIGGPS